MTAPLRLPRRSKYGSVPATVDGIRFHSKGEARRWQELRLLEKAGEIFKLRRQVPFELHVPSISAAQGECIMLGKFVADFSYREGFRDVVEDFKGMMTPLAKWKIAHFEAEYGIKVRLTGKRPSPRRAGRG